MRKLRQGKNCRMRGGGEPSIGPASVLQTLDLTVFTGLDAAAARR